MKCSSEILLAISALIRGICYHESDLRIRENVTDELVDMTFLPHMADLPLLIGKEGRQCKAIRFLCEAIGKTQGVTVKIEFEESYVGQNDPWRPFVPNPEFKRSTFSEVFDPICYLLFRQIPEYHILSNLDRLTVRLEALPEDTDVVRALSDAFYPFGFRNGRKIRIRSRWTSAVPEKL